MPAVPKGRITHGLKLTEQWHTTVKQYTTSRPSQQHNGRPPACVGPTFQSVFSARLESLSHSGLTPLPNCLAPSPSSFPCLVQLAIPAGSLGYGVGAYLRVLAAAYLL